MPECNQLCFSLFESAMNDLPDEVYIADRSHLHDIKNKCINIPRDNYGCVDENDGRGECVKMQFRTHEPHFNHRSTYNQMMLNLPPGCDYHLDSDTITSEEQAEFNAFMGGLGI